MRLKSLLQQCFKQTTSQTDVFDIATAAGPTWRLTMAWEFTRGNGDALPRVWRLKSMTSIIMGGGMVDINTIRRTSIWTTTALTTLVSSAHIKPDYMSCSFLLLPTNNLSIQFYFRLKVKIFQKWTWFKSPLQLCFKQTIQTDAVGCATAAGPKRRLTMAWESTRGGWDARQREDGSQRASRPTGRVSGKWGKELISRLCGLKSVTSITVSGMLNYDTIKTTGRMTTTLTSLMDFAHTVRSLLLLLQTKRNTIGNSVIYSAPCR